MTTHGFLEDRYGDNSRVTWHFICDMTQQHINCLRIETDSHNSSLENRTWQFVNFSIQCTTDKLSHGESDNSMCDIDRQIVTIQKENLSTVYSMRKRIFLLYRKRESVYCLWYEKENLSTVCGMRKRICLLSILWERESVYCIKKENLSTVHCMRKRICLLSFVWERESVYCLLYEKENLSTVYCMRKRICLLSFVWER